MPGTTLADVLHYKTLTAVAQATKPLSGNELPAGFTRVTSKVSGNKGAYKRVHGNRKTAQIVQYGSKSKQRQMLGIEEIPFVCAHTFENQSLPGHILLNLGGEQGPGPQKMAQQTLARHASDFGQTYRTTRAVTIASALCNGAIYIGSEGQILPSSSGAVITADFGIPAAHKGQLNVFGDGAILSADWNVKTTAIHAQLRALKRAAHKATGYPIVHAFYGENIPGYLMGNDSILQMIANNPTLGAQTLTGDGLPDIGGIKWHPMEVFYENAAGAIQQLLGADDIVFTPEPSPDWWELVEGSTVIPSKPGIGRDMTEAIGLLDEVWGIFSYATISDDPAGITQFGGDTWLPIIKVPKAIYIATVPIDD